MIVDVNLYLITNLNRPIRAVKGRYLWILEYIKANGLKATMTVGGEVEDVTQYQLVIKAMTDAFRHLKKRSNVRIFCDCNYFNHNFNTNLGTWARLKWRTLNGKVPANAEMWQELYEWTAPHVVVAMPTEMSHEYRRWMESEIRLSDSEFYEKYMR